MRTIETFLLKRESKSKTHWYCLSLNLKSLYSSLFYIGRVVDRGIYSDFCYTIRILKFVVSKDKGLSKIVYFSQVFNEFLRTWEEIMHLRMVSKRWKWRIVGKQNTFFFICFHLSLHYNLLHYFNVKTLFNLLAPIAGELHFIVQCNLKLNARYQHI